MKYYDVIILGSGIAGSSLAYHLKKNDYKGEILVLSSKIRANLGYNHRLVFKKDIDEYNLPVAKKYKKVSVGAYDKSYFTLNHDVYFINYSETCDFLLTKSGVEQKNEIALDMTNNILKTNKTNYKFKYLIDCTGSAFFLRKKLNFTLPHIYWLVKTSIYKNSNEFDKDTFYFSFSNEEYFEDVYPIGDKIAYGEWVYTKSTNYNNIIPNKKNFFKNKANKLQPLEVKYATFPVALSLPLIHKNFAFLGDSFGNGLPSVGRGITVILDSAKILSKAIKKRDLNYYDKMWKQKYLEKYIKIISLKENTHFNNMFIKKIKNYPGIKKILSEVKKKPEHFINMITDKGDPNFTKDLQKIFPKRVVLWQAYHYFKTKVRYFFMDKKRV
ncbi:hypothetical protein HN789_06300 [archaeon]|jgi:flavin-dependent dehydrogenase|nr:hypothetical protein [archaeon]MBT4022380.1 hypothetical protein [archaeon]MBT4273258.1 hypothetical protein [archaeon]MBT4461299.1 hypothetical protein [archaeon]MBT4858687.1 hypothetical protein [archaeon]